MATAFREHVREHPPETDYVLLADYYLRPQVAYKLTDALLLISVM